MTASPVTTYQCICGAVVGERRLADARKLRGGTLGEDFAQLDPPLVKRVNIPDDALGEHTVLVQRHESAQREGREPLGKHSACGSVALEDSVRDQGLRCTFGSDLVGRLTKGQRFGLGE